MKRPLAVTAVLGAVLAVPSTAGAAHCPFHDTDGFPAVHGAVTYSLSCSTARAIGNKIQRGYARTGQQPRRLKANGMRFRCRYTLYTEDGAQLMRATCRRTTKPASRAELELSA